METLNIWGEETPEGRRYYTLPEAIQAEIIDPIEAGGVVENAEDEFDIDAIAEEALVFVTCEDEDGVQHDNIFWMANPDIGPYGFWDIVKEAAHE